MKTILRFLTYCLLVLSTAALLRADRDDDRRNENIPPGHTMHTPRHQFIQPFASSGPTGYTPQQLRHAYGFDQLNATGAGQIIGIVDAYGSSTIQADLNTFCAQFNLPTTTVVTYYPQGNPGSNTGWATETTLDVEWAHAIAPGATIVVIAAKSASTADLLAAVDYAVSIGAKQVSMSWGGGEYSTEASSDFHFNVPGVTFFASSGDSGAGAEYPAASPYVVGVGGTTLHLNSSNTISSETAWSGSGGGASAFEGVPSYQAGWWTGGTRAVPDVAYDADPSTGVPIYITGTGWAQYGGTSMSAPQWAALFALVNSLRSQSISAAPGMLYSLANANYAAYYHDVTSGSNGHAAGSRFDLVTGLGSPVGNQLVPALAGGGSTPQQVVAPVFSPASGNYSSAQNVAITSATSGASIRYTTNGGTPSETAGTLYSGLVNISA
ncbi:MAG: chitobiase/beta-hexosaminidase C-terminal domain-containing protein, partial [Opitutaceae bacterium]